MQFIGKLYEAKTVAEVKQVVARELAAVQGDPIQTANWTQAIKQRLLDVKEMEANSNQNSKEATKATGVNLGGDKTHNVNQITGRNGRPASQNSIEMGGYFSTRL